MAYNDVRSYLSGTFAAQSLTATASNHVVTVANLGYLPVSEATFVVSIAAVVTASPSNVASTVKYALLSGTTTIGTLAPALTAGSNAFTTFTSPTAIGSGGFLTWSVIGTGTASAVETSGAIQFSVGLAPQFV